MPSTVWRELQGSEHFLVLGCLMSRQSASSAPSTGRESAAGTQSQTVGGLESSRLRDARAQSSLDGRKSSHARAADSPDGWIFHAFPNEPVKIQPIWFADSNFAFKTFELFPSFSIFSAKVISKEPGAGKGHCPFVSPVSLWVCNHGGWYLNPRGICQFAMAFLPEGSVLSCLVIVRSVWRM